MREVVLIVVLIAGFCSAGFVSEVMTGNVVADVGINIKWSCENAKTVFDDGFLGLEIPEKAPFTSEVFNVYVDDEFFSSFVLEEKKVSGMSCLESDEATYRVYVSSGVLEEAAIEGLDFVEFYNEKKSEGEIKIKGVGFGKKFKMGFVNFGLRVAGWFS